MKQTPCEFLMWNVLPVIRREFARNLIDVFNLSQKEAAEKLGATPAAVSQYLSGKRGKMEIKDDFVLQEIKKSSERIFKYGDKVVVPETCRICKLMRDRGLFSSICEVCEEEIDSDSGTEDK